ncbi:MAG: SPOR domain-containing protein [Dysgonamonadaceae bacterium]|jgi:nucleoid DNA-binding protein|nr:SPOR domain-containing protein [Dysgonamonadaceae bacterium]
MQSISSCIAYLLTKYECVIVPGLGAFVVSESEELKNKKGGLLRPPAKFLGFNPNIRHNDGLLADAIAKGKNISYKEACRQISRYTDRIIDNLEKQVSVQMAWVGKLELSDDRKILFTPSSCLSCNADIFGMDNFYLPTIDELSEKDDPASVVRIPAQSSIIRRTLAAAAAIIALLTVAIPVSDHSGRQMQIANILPIPATAANESVTVKAMEEPTEKPTPYYIIIASLPTETSAQVQMEKFRKEGLSGLGIVSAGNKHRIYAARFSDKTEANTFFIRFRNEHPQYQDAWLFIRRI